MFQKSFKLSLFLLLIAAGKVNAQNVAINETGANADASAMLDVQSTKSGVLVPRMTKTQRDAINSPATGLLIYQTDNESGFYYYQGTGGWIRLSTSAGGGGATGNGWALNGNSNTGANAFIGTTDYQDLRFKVENLPVGLLGANGAGNVAWGINASAGYQGVALGREAQAGASSSENSNIALGFRARATTSQALALGVEAVASSNEAIAIGAYAKGGGYQSIALGKGANTAPSANNSVAIGLNAAAGFNVQNAVALGSGAVVNKSDAIILGGSNAQVGIGTSSPADNVKLDVNGAYKLGNKGTLHKNVISMVHDVWYYTFNPGVTDMVITLPEPASSTQATVAVSPGVDLPSGLSIQWARLVAPNQVKVRFGYSGAVIHPDLKLYITVTEF